MDSIISTYAEARKVAVATIARCPLPKLTDLQRRNLEIQIASALLDASCRRPDATQS